MAGFSFGGASQPQAQAQSTPSLFGGNQAASTSTSSPFGGFGGAANTQPQANATGSSLFGGGNNAAANTSGSSLFSQQQAKPAGSLFGSTTTTQPAQSGGLFGNTGTATNNAGGGLFGSTTQNQQQPQQQGGGLFGSTNTQQQGSSLFGGGQQQQQQQQQQSSGGLFGSTQQKPGGLFGSTTTTQPQTGGGLFGSTTQPQQQQQQQQGGVLFGSTQQKPGGLFGSTTNQPAAGGGLFGSTTQPAQQSSGGLFGSTQQQQQPASSGLFGAASQAPGQSSMFGSTSQPLAQSTATPKQEDIQGRTQAIYNAWDVNSPECRFKYYFYNVVDPGTSQHYGRPAGATDEAKWAKAVRDNPDPENMVPVLATGWGDVQKRVEAQEQTASVHQERIKEINAALGKLSREMALSSSVRLQALQHHLQQLQQRLLHLAAMSPNFAPVQSSAFRPEEGEMKAMLEEVKDSLDGRSRAPPAKSGSVGLTAAPRHVNRGRMLGQVNELWGGVEEVRRQRRARGAETQQQWAGDEKLLTEIAVVLEQQQQALSKLSALANDNVFDADVMRSGLAAVEKK